MSTAWRASSAAPLLAFRSALEVRPAHVEVGGYRALHPRLHGFHDALYDGVLILPFDWVTWAREEGAELVQGRGVDTANLDEVRRTLTAHARKDRFMEGHLIAAIEDGRVGALVRRLGELVELEEASSR